MITATPMTPNIAPIMVPAERSSRCSAGAPFHTTIIYELVTLNKGDTVRIPVVRAK